MQHTGLPLISTDANKKMTSLIKRIFYILVILAAVFFAGRVFVSQRSAPLELWHTFVPQEMSVQQIDAAVKQRPFEESTL